MKWGSIEILSLLWILIPAGWVIYLLVNRRNNKVNQLLDKSVLPILAPAYDRRRVRLRYQYWLAAILLMAVALARPQWGFTWKEIRRKGLDIIVVLDTSKSMLATDVKPNRLQQAKWGIRDMLQELRGDRVGLIAFSGSSYLQCPLTIDYAAFLMTLEDLYAGIIPRGGTAMTQALRRAMDSFEEHSGADQAIIMITDGEDHEGNVLELVNALKKENIKVFTLGVGTLDGELIPIDDVQGKSGFLKDKQGRVIKTSLQEGLLQQLALATGGAYVRSAPGDFGLQRLVHEGLASLNRSVLESRMVKEYEDRFVWFLLCALIMLVLEAVLMNRHQEPMPPKMPEGNI